MSSRLTLVPKRYEFLFAKTGEVAILMSKAPGSPGSEPLIAVLGTDVLIDRGDNGPQWRLADASEKARRTIIGSPRILVAEADDRVFVHEYEAAVVGA